jgi:hypothetical protein
MPGDNQILKTKISTSTHGGLSVCAGVYASSGKKRLAAYREKGCS